jgi:hypothetical protein
MHPQSGPVDPGFTPVVHVVIHPAGTHVAPDGTMIGGQTVPITVTPMTVEPMTVANAPGPCSSGSQANVAGYAYEYNTEVYPYSWLYGVEGQSQAIRDIWPCTGSQAAQGNTWHLMANLQSSSNPNGIVQVGYGRAYAGSALKYTYIPNDSSGGSWAYWPGALVPVLGHWVSAYVSYLPSSGLWEYYIDDISAGRGEYLWVTSTWHDGNFAWWGNEAWNTYSVLGVPSGQFGNAIDPVYVRNEDRGTTWLRQFDLNYYLSGNSWFHVQAMSYTYTNDGVMVYTTAH